MAREGNHASPSFGNGYSSELGDSSELGSDYEGCFFCLRRFIAGKNRDHEARPNYWKGYPLPGFSDMLSALSCERLTLVVTSACKVTSFVGMLRSEVPLALVGEIREHEWMLHTLDFAVASPDSALQAMFRGKVAFWYIGAVVLDEAVFGESSIEKLLTELELLLPEDAVMFPPPPRKISKGPGRLLQMPTPLDDGKWSCALRAALEQHLPETVSCPGLGDSHFCMAVDLFANGSDLVQQDWSAIISYMPGIVRRMYDQWYCHALVLTLDYRAAQVARLMQAFVDYMGLSQFRVSCLDANFNASSPAGRTNVLVGTPDRLYHELASNRLIGAWQVILVEADQLLLSQQEQVDRILEYLGERVQLGVHSETMSRLVEDLVGSRAKRIPKAGLSMEGVCQFYATALDEDDKFDKLCRICKQLKLSKAQPTVVCNSHEKVVEVARQLTSGGYLAYAMHNGMNPSARRQRHIIVTDLNGSRGAYDVINFEMPAAHEDYFQRCGMERDQARKRVINLIVENELQPCNLMEEVRRLYGVDIKLYDLV